MKLRRIIEIIIVIIIVIVLGSLYLYQRYVGNQSHQDSSEQSQSSSYASKTVDFIRLLKQELASIKAAGYQIKEIRLGNYSDHVLDSGFLFGSGDTAVSVSCVEALTVSFVQADQNSFSDEAGNVRTYICKDSQNIKILIDIFKAQAHQRPFFLQDDFVLIANITGDDALVSDEKAQEIFPNLIYQAALPEIFSKYQPADFIDFFTETNELYTPGNSYPFIAALSYQKNIGEGQSGLVFEFPLDHFDTKINKVFITNYNEDYVNVLSPLDLIVSTDKFDWNDIEVVLRETEVTIETESIDDEGSVTVQYQHILYFQIYKMLVYVPLPTTDQKMDTEQKELWRKHGLRIFDHIFTLTLDYQREVNCLASKSITKTGQLFIMGDNAISMSDNIDAGWGKTMFLALDTEDSGTLCLWGDLVEELRDNYQEQTMTVIGQYVENEFCLVEGDKFLVESYEVGGESNSASDFSLTGGANQCF